MKIAIAGTVYVGLSNAVLLTRDHEVVAIDTPPEEVAMLNRKASPIVDAEIEDHIQHKPLNPRATLDKPKTFDGADFVIIATPTDYAPESNTFNTKSVEAVVRDVLVINPKAVTPVEKGGANFVVWYRGCFNC